MKKFTFFLTLRILTLGLKKCWFNFLVFAMKVNWGLVELYKHRISEILERISKVSKLEITVFVFTIN